MTVHQALDFAGIPIEYPPASADRSDTIAQAICCGYTNSRITHQIRYY